MRDRSGRNHSRNPPGPRSTRLSRHLVLLVAAALIPAVLLGAGGLWLQYRSDRVRAEAQLVEQARNIARLVDAEFSRAGDVARILAASPALARGDLDAFGVEMQAVRAVLTQGRTGGDAGRIAFFDAEGRTGAGTDWPGGRPSFVQAAMEDGQPHVSDLIKDAAFGPPCAAVAVPVFAAAEDGHRRVVGAVAVTVPRERMLDIVRAARLLPGAFAGIMDRHGTAVARTLHDVETVGRLPTPPVLKAIQSADAGLAPPGSPTVEGVPSTIAFSHAPDTGYIAKLDVPEASFLAPLWSGLVRAAGIGAAVLAGGLVLALLAARRIVGAFRRVPGLAVHGVPARSTGLREADELAAVLAQQGEDLRQAQRIGLLGSWRWDAATDDATGSEELHRIFGLDPAEPFPKIQAQKGRLYPDDEWDRIQAATAPTLATGEGYALEVRAFRGAEPIWVATRGEAVRDAAGRITGLRGTVQDITVRKQAEATLAESEAFLRSVLDASTDCVKVVEADGTVSFMNVNGRCLMEIDDFRAVQGQAWWSLWPEETRPKVRHAVAEALAGRVVRFEASCPTAKGTPKWWDVVAAPMRDAEGRAVRLVSMSREITERKLAEAALAESEARFRAITDAMPQMVWSTRADGFHDYYNQRWYDLTGTTPREVLGEGWTPVFHPDDQDRARARWQRSLATGEPYEIEYRLRMADGAYRWVLGRALPVRDEAGRITRWFGTCTDIEDTVAARETLARSRTELERLVEDRSRDLHETETRLAQAQRMEALGQLAGGIAHDFNNVLQAVSGGVGLIEKRAGGSDEIRRLARMVAEAAGRGASITRRLLAFSRRGDLRTEAIDPVSLLTDMREVLTHTLGAGIGVRVEAAPGLPPLLGDKGQLETVLVNLATNGRDAMSGNGVLTLAAAVEVLRHDDGPGHPADLKAGTYIRLAVTDTGCGMSPEVLARVTEPFFTTKEQGKGTGLGLAMAKGFAGQSGGGLLIESAPGRGTTVKLWFPLADTTTGREPVPNAAPTPQAGPRRARVLLVDDDPIVREVTAEGLEGEGFGVLPAPDGPTALALLDAGEVADVIVCDLSMPGMDGLVVIREAQRRRARLPAVLLTGFATNAAEVAVGGAVSGAFTLLRKPITALQLAERVAVLLEGAEARAADQAAGLR